MSDTVILTMSEFGRTLAENGSRGTDHGHGNAMLAIGAGVKGGRVYGAWPGLRSDRLFEGRDLQVTTDFRDVFAEVVTSHLGVRTPRRSFRAISDQNESARLHRLMPRKCSKQACHDCAREGMDWRSFARARAGDVEPDRRGQRVQPG